MSANHFQPPVYWIEADEEASLFDPSTQSTIARRSLLAYILLNRSVVAHPADFWRSRQTNRLILNPQAQPILKNVLQIHLGDSATIREYMSDRMDKLRHDKASLQSNLELHRYEQHGATLVDKCDLLDGVFTGAGATFPARESRDKRFRRLIRKDLQSDRTNGLQLARCIRQAMPRANADRTIKSLESLTHDRRRFISIDGITSRLTDAGCPRSALDLIHRRLMVLHWEARREGAVELPLLSRRIAERLDSSDPDVFWDAVDHLLGRDFQRAMMLLPWPTALKIAYDLKNDSTWQKFVETYEVIVETVDRDYVNIAKEVVTSKLKSVYPTPLTILLTTRPDKWTILAWVCHAGSWMAGIPSGWALCFRLGSGAGAIKKGYDHVVKIVEALFASERQSIAARVRTLLADATKTK